MAASASAISRIESTVGAASHWNHDPCFLGGRVESVSGREAASCSANYGHAVEAS
jgi:hypothetical protein